MGFQTLFFALQAKHQSSAYNLGGTEAITNQLHSLEVLQVKAAITNQLHSLEVYASDIDLDLSAASPATITSAGSMAGGLIVPPPLSAHFLELSGCAAIGNTTLNAAVENFYATSHSVQQGRNFKMLICCLVLSVATELHHGSEDVSRIMRRLGSSLNLSISDQQYAKMCWKIDTTTIDDTEDILSMSDLGLSSARKWQIFKVHT